MCASHGGPLTSACGRLLPPYPRVVAGLSTLRAAVTDLLLFLQLCAAASAHASACMHASACERRWSVRWCAYARVRLAEVWGR